jgi:hypothetical protein
MSRIFAHAIQRKLRTVLKLGRLRGGRNQFSNIGALSQSFDTKACHQSQQKRSPANNRVIFATASKKKSVELHIARFDCLMRVGAMTDELSQGFGFGLDRKLTIP